MFFAQAVIEPKVFCLFFTHGVKYKSCATVIDKRSRTKYFRGVWLAFFTNSALRAVSQEKNGTRSSTPSMTVFDERSRSTPRSPPTRGRGCSPGSTRTSPGRVGSGEDEPQGLTGGQRTPSRDALRADGQPVGREQLAVLAHKPNTWMDLSGWSPKRFAPELVREIRGRLQDRVLFGTDYPFLTHEQWLGAWATLDLPDEVTEKVLLANATRLLGL